MDDAEASRLLRELNANLHYITSKDPAGREQPRE